MRHLPQFIQNPRYIRPAVRKRGRIGVKICSPAENDDRMCHINPDDKRELAME